MEKLSAKVENWSIVDNLIFNGFRALEPGQRLTGYLMGHTNLPNGVILSAVIKNVDAVNGVVETLNTVYQLGKANEAYELWASEQRQAREEREAAIPSFTRQPVPAFSSAHSLHPCR